MLNLMRISRIYIQQSLKDKSVLTVSGQPAHYIARVLRLKPGNQLIIFNGDGSEYLATITAASKGSVELEVSNREERDTESPLYTLLGLGLSKGDRMDYAVQKSTELGISGIQPLFTEHSDVKLPEDRARKRVAHWQQVAISACEQSGRVKVPEVHMPMQLSAWLKSDLPEKRFMLVPDGTNSLPASLGTHGQSRVCLLIGPEGGFSRMELDEASGEGFVGIKFGSRILRTETAPVSVLSVMQYLWGDI